MNGRFGFAALLAVIGVSIVFGMVVGGRLNAPPVAQAAKPTGALLDANARGVAVPAGVAGVDFSEIAERSIPAIVRVTNTIVRGGAEASGEEQEEDSTELSPLEEELRRMFGPDDPHRGMGRTPRPERSVSGGSGFIVSKDGYIMTNHHVVDGATRVAVTLDGGNKYDAKVIGSDPTIDLALIKIDPKGLELKTLPLGDSDALRPGQWVVAIGNPLELQSTVTVGVVSATRRRVEIGSTVPGIANFIQTDAAINFGNSGGPLLNARGEVVGINTAILRGGPMNSALVEGIGFALPINEARRAAEQLREGGSVKRGYLGITMNPEAVTEASRQYYKLPDARGVIVSGVQKNGPAAKAGLRKDDVVRKINGEAVSSNQDLLAHVAVLRPGEAVALEVWRGGKRMDVSVTLDARPNDFAALRDSSERQTPPEEERMLESEGLGVKVEALSPTLRRRLGLDADATGVVVSEVDPSSPAAEVNGLRPGRVIVAINDEPVRTPGDWSRATRTLRPGDAVKVEFYAGETTASVYFTVPEPTPND
jgi:serine protease Do